jgi:hypothetical protein
MKTPAICLLPFLALWLVGGCASPKGATFAFDDPSSVVARAWLHIDRGCARDEGSFTRRELRLSQIDYSSDSSSVEVSFYIVGTFKRDTDGRLTYKLLDIEMDKTGTFISAATADGSQGVPSHVGF